MREFYQEKLKSLVALRSNLFTCLIVITGGTIGLFFTNISIVKVFPFAIAGTYFSLIFLLNIISVNNEIDISLEELKNEC